MGFLKKLIGQEPLMKTILGTYDLMTTNLECDLKDLSLSDISVVAQIQVVLHTLNENAFRIELKTLEKSTILEGMAYPEISGDFTNYRLTDFNGTGEYLLKLGVNDLRVHTFSRNLTLRYVNLNFKNLDEKLEKLKTFKERKKPVVNNYIFARTQSKKLISLEEEFKEWLKVQPYLWNVYGDTYDTLTKNVKFDYETEWYNEFTEKYGKNIINFILKGHTDKIKHIPKKEIYTFLHLQEKFFNARLMDGSQDSSGKSVYDFIEKARKMEVEETFRSHHMQNKSLIDFSIAYEKVNNDEFDVLNEIEEINEDDGSLAYEIINQLGDLLELFYQNPELTLDDLQSKLNREFQKFKKKALTLKNDEAKGKLLDYLERNENCIKKYSE